MSGIALLPRPSAARQLQMIASIIVVVVAAAIVI